MLIGFFKNPDDEDCSCTIVKYVDRIWLLSERGDARFLREFVVQVEANSSRPLTEVRMGVPVQNILDFKIVNEECFDDTLLFNSPAIYTTHEYRINTKPTVEDNFGVIDHDGLKGIKVFTHLNYGEFGGRVWKALRFILPQALNPGERTEIRVRFMVSSLFNAITPDSPFPISSVTLYYFSATYQEESVAVLGPSHEIKVVPTLGGENHAGGFDVWLYLPPGYQSVAGFEGQSFHRYDEERDFRGEVSPKKESFGWRLRHLKPDKHIVGIGDEFDLHGTLTEAFDLPKALARLNHQARKDYRVNRKLVWVSIGLSVLAIVLSVISLFRG